MKISFEIVPEDNNDGYSIQWQDTLGLSKGYINGKLDWFKRPKEIWCVISNNKNDTLGYYKGLSTAQDFAYFHTKDTLVTLNFMVGLNLFSDKYSEEQVKELIATKNNGVIRTFEPIQINLKSNLRRKIELELKSK